MGLVRNCLTGLGLVFLLLITSCAVGVRGCVAVVDPVRWHELVDEEPDKTRRMVRDFLEGAETEAAGRRGLGEEDARVAVQDYSDGSLRLTLDEEGRRLLEVVARFTPEKDGRRTRVEVVSDAKALAGLSAVDASAPELHREIRDELKAALGDVDAGRVLRTRLLLTRLVRRAEDA